MVVVPRSSEIFVRLSITETSFRGIGNFRKCRVLRIDLDAYSR